MVSPNWNDDEIVGAVGGELIYALNPDHLSLSRGDVLDDQTGSPNVLQALSASKDDDLMPSLLESCAVDGSDYPRAIDEDPHDIAFRTEPR